MEKYITSLFTTYDIAVAAGLACIGLFAWDRLNVRVADDANTLQQKRFIDLLEPSKFVRTRLFIRAWALYFILLSAIYFILCFLAEPLIAIAGVLGEREFGFDPTKAIDPTIKASDPAMPLIISLLITGLLPQFFLIKRLEEVARRLALRVVRIPESFNDLADAFFEVSVDHSILTKPVIEEIETSANVAALASENELDPERIKRALIKIHAFQLWIGEKKPWPGHNVFNQFSSLYRDIDQRAKAIVEDVQDLTERFRNSEKPETLADDDASVQVSSINKDAKKPGENDNNSILKARWIELAKRLEIVTDDVCALIAIFSENAPKLPGSPILASLSFQKSPFITADKNEQQNLRAYILKSRKKKKDDNIEFSWLIITTSILSIIMLLIGFIGGSFKLLDYAEIQGEGINRNLDIGLAWLYGSLIIYGPSAIFAWNWRTQANKQGRWLDELNEKKSEQNSENNAFVIFLQLYGSLFIRSWVVSSISLCFLFFVQCYFRTNDSSQVLIEFQRSNQIWAALLFGCLGAIYATGMVRLFDLRDLNLLWSGSALEKRRGFGVAVTVSCSLFIGCAIASLLFFAATSGTVDLDAKIVKTALYQASSAGIFGAAASTVTILAFSRVNKIHVQRLEIHSRRIQGPFRVGAAE